MATDVKKKEEEKHLRRLRAAFIQTMAHNDMNPVDIQSISKAHNELNGSFPFSELGYPSFMDFLKKHSNVFIQTSGGLWTINKSTLTENEMTTIQNILSNDPKKKKKPLLKGGMRGGASVTRGGYRVGVARGGGGFSGLNSHPTSSSNLSSSNNFQENSFHSSQSYSGGFPSQQSRGSSSDFSSQNRGALQDRYNSQSDSYQRQENWGYDDRKYQQNYDERNGYFGQNNGDRYRRYNDDIDYENRNRDGGDRYRSAREDDWPHKNEEYEMCEEGGQNYASDDYNGYQNKYQDNDGYREREDSYDRGDRNNSPYTESNQRERYQENNQQYREQNNRTPENMGRYDSEDDDDDETPAPRFMQGGEQVRFTTAGPPGLSHPSRSAFSQSISPVPSSSSISKELPPGLEAKVNSDKKTVGSAARHMVRFLRDKWPHFVSEADMEMDLRKNYKDISSSSFEQCMRFLQMHYSQNFIIDKRTYLYKFSYPLPKQGEIVSEEETDLMENAVLAYLSVYKEVNIKQLAQDLNVTSRGGFYGPAYLMIVLKRDRRNINGKNWFKETFNVSKEYNKSNNTSYATDDPLISLKNPVNIGQWQPPQPYFSVDYGEESPMRSASRASLISQQGSENGRQPSVTNGKSSVFSDPTVLRAMDFIRSATFKRPDAVREFQPKTVPFSAFRTEKEHHPLYADYTKEPFTVTIVEFEDFSNFWVMTNYDKESFKQLHKEINSTISSINKENLGIDVIPIGSNVLFYNSLKDQYFRGILLEKRRKTAHILAIDVGGYHDIAKIHVLEDRIFNSIPPLACHCSLGDFDCRNEVAIDDLEERVKRYVESNDIQSISIRGVNNDKVYVSLLMNEFREYNELPLSLQSEGRIRLYQNY